MIPLGLSAFALLGAVLVLLGATADALRDALDLDLQQFGALGSAFAVGMGIGVVGAGPLVDRLPRRPLFVAATALTAAGLALVGDDMSYGALVACVMAIGVGAGAYDTLLNAVTAERYVERSLGMLSLLHAAVPIGAIITPLAVGQVLAKHSFDLVFQGTAVAFGALSVWASFVPLPTPPDGSSATHAGRPPMLRASFVALCVVGFCYVGVEAGLVLFAVPYADEGLQLGAGAGRSSISTFWIGILAARAALALPSLDGRIGSGALVAAGALSALLIAGGVGFAWGALAWLLAVVGLLLGIVYPVMIARAAAWNPGAAGSAAGLVAGSGSLGAFLVPWLTGALGDEGGVHIGFGSIALWSLLLALFAWLAERWHAREAGTSTARIAP